MPEKTSEKILYLISENPRITTRELVDIIGIHERNVARNIKTLQERGLLHRIGGRKEGYWQVQILNSCTLPTDSSPRDDREKSERISL